MSSFKLTTSCSRPKKHLAPSNPLNRLHRRKTQPARARQHKRTSSSSLTAARQSTSLGSSPIDKPAVEDVPAAVAAILARQFSPLPETLVGLGLSRDALTETLTLRRAIPPVVPIAHLHALLPSSPTATERAIAALVAGGSLRRVSILQPGARARFEGVIRTEDFVASVTRCSALSKNVKEAFLGVLAAHPATATIAAETLPRDAVMELLAAGFLTISNVAQLHDPSGSSFGDGASVDIAALTPTVGALIIPQQDHTHLSSLSSLASVSSASSRTPPQLSTAGASVEYTVTPPNLGLLTHLQVASRARMLEILRRCPQREATLAFLREKWDGGVSKQKQARVGRRDPAARKWEGRTRKWREYKGLTADWVIDGMVGGGVLETFHAVGVGMGVKIAD